MDNPDSDTQNVQCPHCGSTDTARIVYGYPVYSDDLKEKLDQKKVHLGGCVIYDEDPDRHCNACEKDFVSR